MNAHVNTCTTYWKVEEIMISLTCSVHKLGQSWINMITESLSMSYKHKQLFEDKLHATYQYFLTFKLSHLIRVKTDIRVTKLQQKIISLVYVTYCPIWKQCYSVQMSTKQMTTKWISQKAECLRIQHGSYIT